MHLILQAPTVAFLAIILIACSPSKNAESPASLPAPVDPSELLARGKTAYTENCANCHYGGRESQLAPDLIGSAIINRPDPDALIKVILHGRQHESVVNGKKFNGIMPPQAYLSNSDIAAICTYIRQEFAGLPSTTVQPNQVKALRD